MIKMFSFHQKLKSEVNFFFFLLRFVAFALLTVVLPINWHKNKKSTIV